MADTALTEIPVSSIRVTRYATRMGGISKGSKNGNWKGGRVVASNGYILIRVGKDHHLSDTRGYAYEHRLIAEKKLGRKLLPGELVHHRDGDKQNNKKRNLEVFGSTAEHFFEHRPAESLLQKPGEPNLAIRCGCGCGAAFQQYDATGRPRSYVPGHNPHPAPVTGAIVAALGKGPLSRRELVRITGMQTSPLATCLSKLKKQGTITNPTHGMWQLVTSRSS